MTTFSRVNVYFNTVVGISLNVRVESLLTQIAERLGEPHGALWRMTSESLFPSHGVSLNIDVAETLADRMRRVMNDLECVALYIDEVPDPREIDTFWPDPVSAKTPLPSPKRASLVNHSARMPIRLAPRASIHKSRPTRTLSVHDLHAAIKQARERRESYKLREKL